MPELGSLNLGEIGKLIATAKQLAKRYRALTDRPIGLTSEVYPVNPDSGIGKPEYWT